MFSQLRASLQKLVKRSVGSFNWDSPPWIKHLHHRITKHPLASAGLIVSVIVLIAALFLSYRWYQSLPQPERVTAQITQPKITPNEKTLVPSPLQIQFGTMRNSQFTNRSVAPLNLIGKEVSDGITIHPAMAGTWTWINDNQLTFTPTNDWPAGETYTINVTKAFFSPNTNMEKFSYTFSTVPFDATINDFKFYQDPITPSIKQAIATVSFNYPVDANSLEDKITLQYQALKNGKQDFSAEKLKYTVTYDEHKRIAYIRSESLQLPETERYLELTLAKDIKAIAGPSHTTEDITKTLLIPDVSSYFKINNISASIIRNDQDKPEQVLTIETAIGVSQKELNPSLHVYLLPKNYPANANSMEKVNYEWQDPGEVTADILALAKPVSLNAIPADRDFATLHSYKFNAATPAYLYIKLDQGITGFGGYKLTHDYAVVTKAPAYPQEISFLHKGAIIAFGTEAKLSIAVRGVAAVKFDFARVLPNDVNHLITQTSGDFNNPYFTNPDFNQNNIAEVFSEIQKFNIDEPGKAQYTALDFNKYLSNKSTTGNSLGLFLLQAQGWDAEHNTALDVQTKRLILITDFGLIVKDNNDGTHDLFVQSIAQGSPVKDASVAILGKNGLPLLTQTTDADGHVRFPVLNNFINEKEPTVYVVHKNNDVSFIPYNRFDRQLNYSRFDVSGAVTNEENTAALSAFIFTDRGIYRPGDVAHIGMIIKRPYAQPETAGLPLQISITDPRGVTVKEQKIELNDTGYLTLDFKTNATASTGQYYINLYIVKDNRASNLIGSSTLNVAEFLPDRMRITSQLSNPAKIGWISPSDLTAKVGLWNLYGAPAADRRISAKILLSPQTVKFKEYPDYTFVDPLLDPKTPPKVFTDTLTDGRTNKQGEAEFNLNLDRFDKATYQLTFFAEGFEAEGGRSVTTQSTALVSPLSYLVGYKADGDLNYLKQNSNRIIHFIAINPGLKQQALSDLSIIVYEQHPITTLVKNADGTYQYQSVIQNAEISKNAFAISEAGINYTLPADKIGNFLIAITNAQGIELSRFKYSIVGSEQLPLPKNAELTLKLNKNEFAAGDEIEMQITAPYTGSGLITIERDKVYAYKWFTASTTASVQKIRLPADFQGGGYVNVAFVRDLNSPEIFMSPLSYSVAPFSITHKNQEAQIDLSAPTLARPGDILPITYKTDKPAKIIVFAVDEGILQVTKFVTPDPLKFFFEKRALQVTTQQIVDQILPKYIAEREISAVGGDNGEAALNKHLNPFKRKTEAPVVYWSGIIDSDVTPQQLKYQIPDYFNGTLRIMAVAAATNAVGSASANTEVRGYFVINPNVPTFAAPDDEFDVTASIANNVEKSGTNANVTVELTASPQLEIIGDSKQNLTIPEGEERTLHFKLRAKNLLGSAELTFAAAMNDKISHSSTTMSIRPASAYLTTVNSGYTTDAKKILPLRVLYPESRAVHAAVFGSPLFLVNGLKRYLAEYPYGCTEQLVSKAFPLLILNSNNNFDLYDNVLTGKKLQELIQKIALRQLSSGGFAYWPEFGSTENNDFASIYAMHFLTEAKAQGNNVPIDVFSAGLSYLKEFASQPTHDLTQARLRAYAIYVLTRNEIVTTNYLTNLQLSLDKQPTIDWHNDITSVYIAATYQMLKSESDAEKIITYFKPANEKSVSFDTDFYNQDIANAQYIYLLANHFPKQLQQINDDTIMSLVNALSSDTLDTTLAGYSSLALSAYGKSYPHSTETNQTISVLTQDGKENLLASATGTLFQDILLDEKAQQVIFNNPSREHYFYQLTQSGFDKNLPTKAINKGLEVYREYQNMDNSAIETTRLGEEIIVRIHARALDNQYHNNIALVDLLPGGFEVIRDSLNMQNIDYADVREDRVIFFTSLGPDAKEITYKIKATNTGKFIVPPMIADAMYNPQLQSISLASHMTVTAP